MGLLWADSIWILVNSVGAFIKEKKPNNYVQKLVICMRGQYACVLFFWRLEKVVIVWYQSQGCGAELWQG